MDILNAGVALLNFVVVPAAAYGAQLALGALGVTLIYGILRFSNFAFGDTMAMGTAFTIMVTWAIQALGIAIFPLPTALIALPFGIAVTALIVLFTDRIVYRFYRRKKVDPIVMVMASVGVMFVMNGLTRVLIGVEEIRFDDGARFLFSVQDFRAWSGLTEGLSLRVSQLLTLIITALVCWGLFVFLNRTRTGKAMRAYSDNEDLALLSGIDPDQVVRITWIIGTALAVIAGTLYGLDKTFKAFNYFQILLPIFAAAIVGGLGNPLGAVVGGFVVAFSEVAITYPWKKVAGYLFPDWQPEGLLQLLSTEYKFAVSFVILIVVLLFKPTGLFRGKSV
ncbi:branched-chain amino acid ABC transporter permease [Paracoccus sulfuroxidans]|uniref:Branched-chain amino acid transport system permease protein n=1 Tax=Paracoccus sulfuroxidans TaxID=384678 RepID=A0A562NLT8_9RHOB|nr:branched-chain amino acid ABC transporter permease [Paracoccus sulfuroxidans]TWI32951.1 branched-chain amino acid transport system permease protein [Paracoccus sulfuroxidans]